jgi:hypothetical protein
MFQY